MTIKKHDFFGLNELDVDRSMRLDEMYHRLIKELANFVSNPLSICFNLSVIHGRLPKDWNNVIVSPVFMTGMKHKPEDYRSAWLLKF